ncbi:NAD(P)/FAD-dependent oxidoreductase [Paenibacillus abyssi]|uniref:Ferredoxin reductase n=1 Tax=Paenibacillus abyssi TaxID=1340531 RepID=A0A917LFS5_9BACL|nr:FAD-dependent oxidoreductase [Paenibacillus abyssi]GGG19046.1 ferredoxin reductase [Paenibacillus abyssi]
MTDIGMVIIGAGEAGARAAVQLREEGWSGPITLIGEERLSPYERPPLSKGTLLDKDEPAPVWILNEERLAQHDITFISGCGAVDIDRERRTVLLEDGRLIPYFRLLLTTGARPRKYKLEGSEDADVLYLRTYADAMKLRDRLHSGMHVAVIGGGFIGLEVTASAIERGCTVSLIELGPRILSRGVPKEIADVVEARHRKAGVDFKFGVPIEKITKNGERQTIVLADGSTIECNAIIIGIGAIPESSLAEKCGLEIDNGIRVDEMLRTSDPFIYAAGDCCSFPHPFYGGRRIRLEAWRNAQDQGTLAAHNMMGADKVYKAVPWFWSDQYELTLQVTGLTDAGETIVSRDIGEEGRFYFHLAGDGSLVAASAIGPISKIAKDIRFSEMLIHQGARPDPEALANPDVKLRSLAMVVQ